MSRPSVMESNALRLFFLIFFLSDMQTGTRPSPLAKPLVRTDCLILRSSNLHVFQQWIQMGIEEFFLYILVYFLASDVLLHVGAVLTSGCLHHLNP